MQNNLRVVRGLGLVLLIPVLLTALALWHWKPGVFVIGALLLLCGAGLVYELTVKRLLNNKRYRYATAVGVAAVLLLVWMNAAVGGILGDNPANMMYPGVLLVGGIGALMTDLEPAGMSRALFAMAFAVLLVPLIALIIGTPAFANGVLAVFALHTGFAIVFALSAILFQKARSR